MWGFVTATIVLLAAFGGVFYAGVSYGDLRTEATYNTQAITERDKVIAHQDQRLKAKDGEVEQAQANMSRVADDLSAIRRTGASVGSQLRSALDASNMGTCVLSDDTRSVRAGNAEATAAAARAANGARGPD